MFIGDPTGAALFKPLNLQLFSAGAFKPLYGQWTLTVAFPLGAILLLMLRGRLRKGDPLKHSDED